MGQQGLDPTIGTGTAAGGRTVDVVVVGGGLAGLTAAATAAGDGRIGGAARRSPGRQPGRHRDGGPVPVQPGGPRPLPQGGGPAGPGSAGRAGHAAPGRPSAGAWAGGATSSTGCRSARSSRPAAGCVSRRGLARLARVLAGMPRWRPDRPGRTAPRPPGSTSSGSRATSARLVEMLTRTATYVADLDTVSADLVALQVRLAAQGNVRLPRRGLADAPRRPRRRRASGPGSSGCRPRPARSCPRAGWCGSRSRPVATATAGCGARRRGGHDAAGRGRRAWPPAPPTPWRPCSPSGPAAWAALAGPIHVACLDLGLAERPPTRVLLGLDRPHLPHLPRAAGPPRPAGGAVVHGHALPAAPPRTCRPPRLRGELEDHARLAGIDPDAAEEARYRHRMVSAGALPIPETGGLARRPGVDEQRASTACSWPATGSGPGRTWPTPPWPRARRPGAAPAERAEGAHRPAVAGAGVAGG